MSLQSKYDFICYGEILWDILPTGRKPGGAPMNVGYHLNRLGHHPAIITRVGNDKNGNDLLSILKEKSIPTDYVQHDTSIPTGIVHATPNEHGEMSYEIVSPAAWDNIEWADAFENLFTDTNYLVFGSLICRNDASKNTLFRLLEVAKNKVLDINLRPPFYNNTLIRELMEKANVVKLNRDELDLISRWNSDVSSAEDQIKNVQEQFRLSQLIVTLGGDGAIMNIDGRLYRHPGYAIVVEDTVGSGDAFLAALLSGLSRKNDPGSCLSFACSIGALVTSKKGAWPEYHVREVEKLKGKS